MTMRQRRAEPVRCIRPVKFLSGSQLSAGHYDFRVTNMRDSVGWALFEGSLTTADGFRVVALYLEVHFSDARAPMHLRLSRTSSTDQMRVSWTWSPAGTRSDAQVRWGLAPSALNWSTDAIASTYAAPNLCGPPGAHTRVKG